MDITGLFGRSVRWLLPIVLVWMLPRCEYAEMWLEDAYITGPLYGDYNAGRYSLGMEQTSREFAIGKPIIDCAVSWEVVAYDINGIRLPDFCQPQMVSVDGESWPGM